MSDNIQEVIEDKIIDCINSDVSGRLIIVKPNKNVFNIGLTIARRGKYNDEPLYLQINSFVGPDYGESLIKDISEDSLKSNESFYLTFVYFDEVSQKINDYIWLVPSKRFIDLAELVKSPEGENMLRFESSLDVKHNDKYSKFRVKTEELGKLVLESFEKGGLIEFKGAGFVEKNLINIDSLANFLFEARRNTFAAESTPESSPRLLASTQLEFQKGGYFYMDIYFNGDKRFTGQEIIYQDDKPIWLMSYIGNQIGKTEENFLRESLYKLSEKCRLGGVCEYKKRELKYKDHGQGSLDSFSGKEEIFLDDKSIYELNYQGGLISDKI